MALDVGVDLNLNKIPKKEMNKTTSINNHHT